MAADKTVERRFDAGRFNSVRAVFVAFGRFLNSCNFSGIGKIQRLQIKNLRRNLQTIFRYIHKRFNCSCWSDSPQPSSLPLSPRCGLRQASASERPTCCYLKCADRRGGRESVVFQEPEEQERRNTLVAVAERAVLDRRVGRIGRLFLDVRIEIPTASDFVTSFATKTLESRRTASFRSSDCSAFVWLWTE